MYLFHLVKIHFKDDISSKIFGQDILQFSKHIFKHYYVIM